jgi:hypothetical protein
MNILNQLIDSLDPTEEPIKSGVSIEADIQNEQAKWQGKKETEMAETLSQYWDLVGVSNWTPSGLPWSAAWVSWMMRDHGLNPQAAHWRYVDDTIKGKNSGWKAYAFLHHPNIEISEGDIVVRPRGSGAPQSAEFYQTHGDIVASVSPSRAITYGGNLSDTMSKSGELKLENGKLTDPGQYLVILKKKKKLIPTAIPLVLIFVVAGGLLWSLKK